MKGPIHDSEVGKLFVRRFPWLGRGFGRERPDPNVAGSQELLEEFRQEMSGKAYLAISLIYLIWLVYISLKDPNLLPGTSLSMIGLVLLLAVAPRFTGRNLPVALFLWNFGLVGINFWTSITLAEPRLGYFLILLLFVASLSHGLFGTVIAGFLGSISLLIPPGPFQAAIPDSASYQSETIIGAALAGILGWYLYSVFYDQLRWLAYHYFSSHEALEEARNYQLELNQVKEDLLLANRELARLTERLRAMTQVAESALKAKEEFVANVSHELRTPLNMIIGFSETIARNPYLYGVRLPKKLLEDISTILRNSQHLSELVNDVLDLSQVEAGRMAITRGWTDLNKIVEDAIEQIRPLFASKNLYLNVSLLPETPLVFCDETRIREVIINLLSNAGRFTDQGGVELKLSIEEGNYLIRVTDTGPGIPENQLEAIFEPFRQLDSSIRRQHGGSGLGLTICKRFVEMHEGKMWVESQLGVGTTFYVSLPQEVSTPQQASSARRWVNPYLQFTGRDRPFKAPVPVLVPRFVVFESGDALTRILRRYMEACEIVLAHSLAEVEAEIKKSPTQALIINTSEVDPGQVKAIVRLAPFGTLAITCFMPSYQDYAHQLGVMDYLIKPVSSEQLIATLERYANRIEQILVVDDQPEMLQLLTRLIETTQKNYKLLFASNGAEALEILHRNKPDIVLLDLIMPEVDGFAVIRAMQKDSRVRDIPVVVLSSRDPTGAPVISDSLQVFKEGGFTVSDLVSSIRLLSDLLVPGGRYSAPVPPKGSPA